MASATSNYPLAEHSPAVRAAQSIGFVTGVWACFALALGFAAGMRHRTANPPAVSASERVNPNDAPASSLARLPGIGPARARAIIAHRDGVHERTGRRSAFRNARDLQEVKGIGPATVNNLQPWLQFDGPFPDGDTSPER